MFFFKKEGKEYIEIKNYNIIDIILNQIPVYTPFDMVLDRNEIVNIKMNLFISLIGLEKIYFKGNKDLEKDGYLVYNNIYYYQQNPVELTIQIKNNKNSINIIDENILLGHFYLDKSIEQHLNEKNIIKRKKIQTKKEKIKMTKFIINFLSKNNNLNEKENFK